MKKPFFVPFLFGILLLAACGGSEPVDEATQEQPVENNVVEDESTDAPADDLESEPEEPTPTVSPTNTPVSTEEPEPEPTDPPAEEANEPVEENEIINSSDINFSLEGLESYTLAFQFSLIPEGANEVTQSIAMNGVFQSDPPAQRMEMSFTDTTQDDELNNGTIVMTLVDGVSYSAIPGFADCISVPTDQMGENPVEELLTSETFLGDINGFKRVRPNEVINGVETIHYVFDETTLIDEDVEFEDVSGDIYLTVDTGYVVRLVMEGKNPIGFDLSEDASPNDQFTYVFDLMNINEPVEVSLPDECQTAEQGAGFPKPADASQVGNIGGIETYQTGLSAEEIAMFYQEVMPGEGWTRDDEESVALGELLTEVYTNGSDQLQILIAPSGDVRTVTLIVEPIE